MKQSNTVRFFFQCHLLYCSFNQYIFWKLYIFILHVLYISLNNRYAVEDRSPSVKAHFLCKVERPEESSFSWSADINKMPIELEKRQINIVLYELFPGWNILFCKFCWKNMDDNFFPSVIANSYYANVIPKWVEIFFELASYFPKYVFKTLRKMEKFLIMKHRCT